MAGNGELGMAYLPGPAETWDKARQNSAMSNNWSEVIMCLSQSVKILDEKLAGVYVCIISYISFLSFGCRFYTEMGLFNWKMLRSIFLTCLVGQRSLQ